MNSEGPIICRKFTKRLINIADYWICAEECTNKNAWWDLIKTWSSLNMVPRTLSGFKKLLWFYRIQKPLPYLTGKASFDSGNESAKISLLESDNEKHYQRNLEMAFQESRQSHTIYIIRYFKVYRSTFCMMREIEEKLNKASSLVSF